MHGIVLYNNIEILKLSDLHKDKVKKRRMLSSVMNFVSTDKNDCQKVCILYLSLCDLKSANEVVEQW